MNDINETHPFLVSVWVVPTKEGQPFLGRAAYWMEMARCMSEYRANKVAYCLAIRYRLVQVSKLEAYRFIPIRHLPDEETVKRETAQKN